MKKMLYVCTGLAVLLAAGCLAVPQGQGTAAEARWVDVHGAGSQRSDPKSGDPALYASGHGPQGDAVRIYNMARAVRTVARENLSYPIVDTNQTVRYGDKDALNPSESNKFLGQDADYNGIQPSYIDNGDGTVTDTVTGLVWQQKPGAKLTWAQAFTALNKANAEGFLGYHDWRIPSIKELYSLIQFSGSDVAPDSKSGSVPFIDRRYFDFSYGDEAKGERIIDSQYLSSTKYVATTMAGDETVFGVNFADGRIKGYGMKLFSRDKTFTVLFVRGNSEYGKNRFMDNGDGTITDTATGLMWTRDDAGTFNWEESLRWAEGLSLAGYDDWRLPNAKELQSIVDYNRSPETTKSAAIDPVFRATEIRNEMGEVDYGFYWSSTTHASSAPTQSGKSAVYLAFGKATGNIAALAPPTGKTPPPMNGGLPPPMGGAARAGTPRQ